MRVTRNFFRVFPLRYHVGNATAQWALYRCPDSILVSSCKGNIIIEEKGRFQENYRKMLGLPTPDRLPSRSLTRYGIYSREEGEACNGATYFPRSRGRAPYQQPRA